ncbi:MAG: DMT family transporter [Desulfitobacteriaceae bacterium]|nr:DMT family transporter [Desulfitobacteriaceae bacterium]
MNKKQLGADLALLFVAAIWGATFVTVKNALADITPFYFNALRFSLAALILGVISWRKLPRLNKSLIASGSLIGFFLFAGYSFQTIGLQYTSASNAGFITGLSVVLVPFFSIYFSKKAPSLEATLGALMAAVGLGLLSLDETLHINTGDFLVFLCAISFALHIIFVGRYSPVHDTFLLVTIQVAAVAVLSSFGAFFFEPPLPALTGQVWVALLITAILATVVAFLVQNWMQKFTTPTRTAIILSMEPVFGALFAFLLLGEILSTQDWFGSSLVFLGMILAEVPLKKRLGKIIKKAHRY